MRWWICWDVNSWEDCSIMLTPLNAADLQTDRSPAATEALTLLLVIHRCINSSWQMLTLWMEPVRMDFIFHIMVINTEAGVQTSSLSWFRMGKKSFQKFPHPDHECGNISCEWCLVPACFRLSVPCLNCGSAHESRTWLDCTWVSSLTSYLSLRLLIRTECGRQW